MHLQLTILIALLDLIVAPPLESLYRFPVMSRPQWNQVEQRIIKRQDALLFLRNLYPLHYTIRDELEDMEFRRKAWDYLDRARWCPPENNSNWRRCTLLQLFELIGPENFNAGRMPEPL